MKDKILNKDSKLFTNDIRGNNENSTDFALLKMQFEYSDDIINIPSFINIYFIYNSFENILPLFSITKKMH